MCLKVLSNGWKIINMYFMGYILQNESHGVQFLFPKCMWIMCACMCVREYVSLYLCACMCVHVCECVYVQVSSFLHYLPFIKF